LTTKVTKEHEEEPETSARVRPAYSRSERGRRDLQESLAESRGHVQINDQSFVSFVVNEVLALVSSVFLCVLCGGCGEAAG
jgi:hypothetical protein